MKPLPRAMRHSTGQAGRAMLPAADAEDVEWFMDMAFHIKCHGRHNGKIKQPMRRRRGQKRRIERTARTDAYHDLAECTDAENFVNLICLLLLEGRRLGKQRLRDRECHSWRCCCCFRETWRSVAEKRTGVEGISLDLGL